MHAYLVNSYQQLATRDTLEIIPEKSIGIEEVRQIQTFLARKPTHSPHNIVVIRDAHLLTLPAQNALLKTLEEPPAQALIYLVTGYPDQLIPTVLSRIQIETSPKPITSINPKSQELLERLLKAKIEYQLRILDEVVFTRDTALDFLIDLESIIHENLDLAKLYDLVVETRKYLKANVSVKLSMDNLAIGLQNK